MITRDLTPDNVAAVTINPSISRDSKGIVKRQQLVVVIDVTPDGNSFNLDVTTESSYQSMIRPIHPIFGTPQPT